MPSNTVPSADPNVMAPKASRETIKPVSPSRLYCIEILLDMAYRIACVVEYGRNDHIFSKD
jgi:hypothetical protein